MALLLALHLNPRRHPTSSLRRQCAPVQNSGGFIGKFVVAALLLLAGGAGGFYLAIEFIYASEISQASGFVAKTYCSNRFIAGRTAESIIADELNRPELALIGIEEYTELKAATAYIKLGPLSATGYGGRPGLSATAIYRPGLGCTLAIGIGAAELAADLTASPDTQAPPPWQLPPTPLPADTNAAAAGYVNSEFVRQPGTRALLVWHKDRLIAEQYAEGFSASTPLISWSMAKSVTHALLGIAVQQGWLNTEDAGLLRQWRDDDRRNIRLHDLVQMRSGLKFDEVYDLGNDAVRMLYATHSASDYAAEMPLERRIGEHWQYSSGTSNILARVIGDTVRQHTRLSPAQFARQYLFDPLGTESFTTEPDAGGNLLGSSYIWATARDWLIFGRLYLNDGWWQGRRILPPGWADAAAEATPHSNGTYGGHFWINGLNDSGRRVMPNLPADTYYASGFEGQDVVIIPSLELVVVRLGLTPLESDWDLNTHLSPLLALLKP